jgi:hypothetical protein
MGARLAAWLGRSPLERAVAVFLFGLWIVVWLMAGRPDPVPLMLALAGFVLALLGVRRFWPDDGSEPATLGAILIAIGVTAYFWAGQVRGGGANGFFLFFIIIAAAAQLRRRREQLALRAG